MTALPKSPERIFCAICTNGVFRIRTRATVGPQNASLRTESRASAFHYRSSARLLPLGRGKLPAAIERTISLVALAAGSFIQQGTRWICDFCRSPFAAGKRFSFRSLLKHLQEPSCVQSVLICPNDYQGFLSSAVVHAHTKAWSKQHGAQRNSASGA